MAGKITVDYNALQGDSFFGISKQHMEYVLSKIDGIHLDASRTAGSTALYALVAHKRLLRNSIIAEENGDRSFLRLYENTEQMMIDLGLKFSQIDEKLKTVIEENHEAGV